MRAGSATRILTRAGAVAGAVYSLTGCQNYNLFDAKGPVGAAEANILIIASVIMLAIIVPTMIATIVFAWWYREGNTRAQYRPNWAFSGRIEMVVWSVPLLTIIFLGGIAWIGAHRLDPMTPLDSDRKPIEVQVVSLDWKWLFIYPEQGVASVNRLVMPAATPVQFRLTSSSVWNSFFIPRLGSMIYTMRGMTTRLNLMADREGELYGLSTHFSGDGFADMNFPVQVASDEGFAEWVRQAKASSLTLDAASYAALAKQSTGDKPRLYGTVDPKLFDGIVAQTVPPGPGPSAPGGVEAVRPKGGS
ncbi:ubiquinol oxidase subunit II [Methylorubrum sp. POS3]|uniref:ubiquinol oxidase subunit II n=1 Tax=Methylorubrum sp. POS3 TaxID=2998492 RepID=UPI00372C69F8